MSEMVMTPEVRDTEVLVRASEHARSQGIVLPTFADMAAPQGRPSLGDVPASEPHPANLFRIHWYNRHDRPGAAGVPPHLEIPPAISGVNARIVVILGDTFPMIAAHKVLAAYACLVTRLVTGRFDPLGHKAVWPSTGNYCRGGIAISRILGCRGAAVLPEQMSRERFNWLEQWTLNPDEDIVRTTGSESNVREIYEACDELAREPSSIVLNQFSEFANYLAHRRVTGPAIADLFESVANEGDRLHALIAGTGSAGTIAAGDHLKATYGSRIVVTEPLECPTLLENGYGEHNIQGIGDKHVPLIHNVMNMDYVIGVSDTGPDLLNALCNTEAGQRFLRSRTGVSDRLLQGLTHIGLSGLANIQSAIKLARHAELDASDVIVCVATDGAALYESEREKTIAEHFGGRFDEAQAAEVFGRTLAGLEPSHVLELTTRERRRIFNLGYYTWVEQRGVALDDFDRRRHQSFWDGIAAQADRWDDLIEAFNRRVASKEAPDEAAAGT